MHICSNDSMNDTNKVRFNLSNLITGGRAANEISSATLMVVYLDKGISGCDDYS